MPPKRPNLGSHNIPVSKKRKEPPQSSSASQQRAGKGHDIKRVKTRDARSISTQSSDAALKNGELDVQSFLKSREFEIKALQDGMQRAKNGRTTRAFQQVPRDLRRRTASHNVKRVPQRLQKRAANEMKEDNTPTVTPNKRKPGSARGRLRAETAKRLGLLAAKKRSSDVKNGKISDIKPRSARLKIRKNKLNDPPKPKSKFRKRQIHKTWLPTHLWHAKRAKMTEPGKPLWRFAIPVTSTEKSYRPTHRAGGARGAVAWDMSYISTIGLEGQASNLEKVLKAIGLREAGLWDERGEKWRDGKRSWNGWLSKENNDSPLLTGPATILWCPAEVPRPSEESTTLNKDSPPSRRVFVRVHPAIFIEIWDELRRLARLQRPAVHLEDLRFEVGSIEITGSASTESLLGILHPYSDNEHLQEEHAKTFLSLIGLTNPASLPSDAVLSFSIMDPRLRYPPRPVKVPSDADGERAFELLERLATWPVDKAVGSTALFDRGFRYRATGLPSQKSLNRRKSLAVPGTYPSPLPTDPPIPIVLLASRAGCSGASQGSWTLLAPWKCILPIWYGLMHFPLSSGGNPRFGGLQELRQTHFERGLPWFPADFPGTRAGHAWEIEERARRKQEWDKRPKGKRIEWSSLDLGNQRKGEIGQGWACDFERILETSLPPNRTAATKTIQGAAASTKSTINQIEQPTVHFPSKSFITILSGLNTTSQPPHVVATVHVTLISKGVAVPCARIYRLPIASDPSNSRNTSTTREEWTLLLPTEGKPKLLPRDKAMAARSLGRIPLDTPLPQRVRLLAKSLLQQPPLPYPANKQEGSEYPLVPDEKDLIGFITTGEFNLAEGKGAAIGTVFVSKILEALEGGKKGAKEGRLCIVRNAGEKMGRLARWEPI